VVAGPPARRPALPGLEVEVVVANAASKLAVPFSIDRIDVHGRVFIRRGMATTKPPLRPRLDRNPLQIARIGLQSRGFGDLYHQLL